MSNYVKTVDFAIKDTLTSGDPNKLVKGVEINTELANIATAIGTKADTTYVDSLVFDLEGQTINGGTY